DEGHDGGGSIDFKPPDGFSALVEMTNSGATDADLTLTVNNTTTTVFTASANDPAPHITSTNVSSVAPGTVLRSFLMPVEGGNGRAIAFDGTYLYTTVTGDSKVYKLTTSGSSVSNFDVGTTLGALAYNGGFFYGGDYSTGGNVYKIDPANPGGKAPRFLFSDAATCLGIRNFLDRLVYPPRVDNLALSSHACDT